MRTIKGLFTGLLWGIVLWWALASLLSFLGSATNLFYRDLTEREIVRQRPGEAIIRVNRFALTSMAGTCDRELICDLVIGLPSIRCPIEQGYAIFDAPLPFTAQAINGSENHEELPECYYTGTVSFRPLGIGFVSEHNWRSETFTPAEFQLSK